MCPLLCSQQHSAMLLPFFLSLSLPIYVLWIHSFERYLREIWSNATAAAALKAETYQVQVSAQISEASHHATATKISSKSDSYSYSRSLSRLSSFIWVSNLRALCRRLLRWIARSLQNLLWQASRAGCVQLRSSKGALWIFVQSKPESDWDSDLGLNPN